MKFAKKIFERHADVALSGTFFLFLFFFQYRFFNYELGVLTSYVNNFNALNELTFWSNFYGNVKFLTPNPLSFNFINSVLFLLSKITGKFFIFTVIPIFLTTLSFLFAIKIFNLYNLYKSWAVLLAFLGITSISSMPIMEVFFHTFSFNYFQTQSFYGYFDLLASFSSSLVLFIFLGFLYISLKAHLYNLKYRHFIPFLSFFLVFIHPSLFLFGYSFIVLLNFASSYRSYLRDGNFKIVSYILLNLTPLFFVIPYISFSVDFFGSSSLGQKILNESMLIAFIKASIFYFLVPFGAMLLAVKLFKFDPFESLVRFWPILLIALIELIVRALLLLNYLPINNSVIIDRVSIYFLHFFYYLPFLSVVTRKFNYLPDINSSSDSSELKFQQLSNKVFIDHRKLISLVIMIFISITLYNSINHQSYIAVNNQAKLLKNDLPSIFSDTEFLKKKPQFLSMDKRIISNFIFQNQFSRNSFMMHGNDVEVKEFDLMEYIYAKESTNISPTKPLDFLDPNFNKNSFYSTSRNLNLIYWLKYNHNHNDENIHKLISQKINNDFFNNYYLISHNKFNIPEDFPDVKSKNIGNYLITYIE